ncbi:MULTISPECIES: head GIN domain-containing protein [unclassified Sphingomonas]|uniref:head GIN domain-containing protein n=1 Tax=unclassified Sphingomonas TaxID=196159 RepID=UPI0008365DA0|nr:MULTISPECIES: head GIN domain-containing protein [unclassified Sphingomonas]
MHWSGLIILLPLAACNGDDGERRAAVDNRPAVAATGSGAERSFAATGFDRVELAGVDDVEITTGGEFSVRASGDPKILDQLKIMLEDGQLVVTRKRDGSFRWNSEDGAARIAISMPVLRAGSIAGSGDMTVDRVANDFAGAIAGSGDMTIGMIRGDKARLSIAGSGSIAASGEVRSLTVELAGSGDVQARALKASSADVSIAGAGNVAAAVVGDAKVALLGSGDVDLGPAARCSVSKIGSGEARCGS